MKTLDAILKTTSEGLKYFAALLLIFVAILIAFDVFMRAVVNRPLLGIAEIVANGIVVIAYLQLAYTVRIGAMLRSEILSTWLPRHGRIVFEFVAAVLGVLFFGLIAWTSYEPFVRAFETNEFEGHASFQVPSWPLRFVIVACSVLAVLNYIAAAIKALTGHFPGDPEDHGDTETMTGTASNREAV